MASKTIKFGGNEYKISYEIENLSVEPYILVLHGWGAKKELMQRVFEAKFFPNYRLVFVDLPGFGASSQPKFALTSEDYAGIMREFIAALGGAPEAIMGHSFGGKVATLLAPKRLILLSSAGIIEPKPLKVRAKIVVFKCLKYVGLAKFWRFFASKDASGMSEEMFGTLKNVIREDFEPIFAEIKPEKTLIFWGISDTATALSSGEKIHSLIKNSKFYPLDGDHFFFIKHAKFIADTITAEFK
ncbi:alpha/beta hydrolase [Campylobacter sp. JMF_06 NA1]|uniref:alpha/beta fold hydrolase n=1 Tax=Campylobacter sp. JMF_06 NA1 TaxID=2983823 RepID=UPI0022EA0766|nr:alpha/beta hydrolase [Campylobacter sp. JMF_06 NA1]MDA3077644.1 alpha/beta hydrolase [Campylobacter sp. JMF_06 NA1]